MARPKGCENLLFALLAVLQVNPGGCLPDRLLRAAEALERCGHFLRAHLESTTLDHALGAAIAQGQVSEARGTLCGGHGQGLALPTVCARFEKIIEDFSRVRGHHAVNGNHLTEQLLSPDLWLTSRGRARWPLPLASPAWPKCTLTQALSTTSLVVQELTDGLAGSPSEPISASCLLDLLAQDALGGTRLCILASQCVHAETDSSGRARGFAATHRLMFHHIANKIGCRSRREGIGSAAAVSQLCRDILREANQIACRGFPTLLRDLFAEQVALCGVRGYREFAQPAWLDQLLSWQTPLGCFGNHTAAMEMVKSHIKHSARQLYLRDELPGACSSHLTGTAAAALAVNVRSTAQRLRASGWSVTFQRAESYNLTSRDKAPPA